MSKNSEMLFVTKIATNVNSDNLTKFWEECKVNSWGSVKEHSSVYHREEVLVISNQVQAIFLLTIR